MDAGNVNSRMIGAFLMWWRARGRRASVKFAYLAATIVFLVTVASYHDPERGFSRLIEFGGKLDKPRVQALDGTSFHYLPDSYGYDAQYYVQIAMSPLLGDPVLREAVDAPSYRSRRILLSWTAWLAGGGNPEWILQAYAIQNAVAWLALAAVLLHWFPPVSWSNLLRWLGVLFSCGMCMSVRNALIDGPSLLFIALGVLCLERGKPWWAAGALALGGLVKETNLFGGAALIRPEERTLRGWLRMALGLALVAVPLAIWLVYVQQVMGTAADAGGQNFSPPFLSYFVRWQHTFAGLKASGWAHFAALMSLLMLTALTVQWLFLALCPRWREAWWRVGACYALLMMVLGPSVWEGFPGAAWRVLLPMQVAFNVLVPRSRRWLAVLVLGNLTILAAPELLSPPGEDFTVKGFMPLAIDAETGRRWNVEFTSGWHAAEHSGKATWRWSNGDQATLAIVNPHPRPVLARIQFRLAPFGGRKVTVTLDGVPLWTGELAEGKAVTVAKERVLLKPGANRVDFVTDTPATPAGGTDSRSLAFSVGRIEFTLLPESSQ